jgi:hypothetical protein
MSQVQKNLLFDLEAKLAVARNGREKIAKMEDHLVTLRQSADAVAIREAATGLQKFRDEGRIERNEVFDLMRAILAIEDA